ncbi:hypothetical protein [Streptomyces sp. NPDC055400]
MSGLWRQVLAALHNDHPHEQHVREELLALGAAELAHARRSGDEPLTAEDVQRIALSGVLPAARRRAGPCRPRPARQPGPVTSSGLARWWDDAHDAAAGARQRPARPLG